MYQPSWCHTESVLPIPFHQESNSNKSHIDHKPNDSLKVCSKPFKYQCESITIWSVKANRLLILILRAGRNSPPAQGLSKNRSQETFAVEVSRSCEMPEPHLVISPDERERKHTRLSWKGVPIGFMPRRVHFV